MERFFYIPLQKQEDEFVQNIILNSDELLDYEVSNYKPVIETEFVEGDAVVRLSTGKYITKIYSPKDEELNVYFCIVNANNYPHVKNEILIGQDLIISLKDNLSLKVKESEGIVVDQAIDIRNDFVTPRVKSKNSTENFYYQTNKFLEDCIILGAPGSGKTTLLRKLTLDLLSTSLESNGLLNKVPIYVQLREYNDYSSDFTTFINNCVKNSLNYNGLYDKFDWLDTGNVYLLLDGADEVDFEKFESLSDTIIEFKRKNPLVTFIITSRPDKKYDHIKNFSHFEILPFDHNQIKNLTFRKLSKHGKWKEYMSILNSVPEIYDILKNPLLLTISHFLFLHKSILPLNRSNLLGELVELLVSNWDVQRKIERRLNNKIVNPIKITSFLGKTALILSELKQLTATPDELFEKIKDFDSKEDLIIFLRYVQFSTGIIIRNENEKWSFAHKSLQDYFCSNYLVEGVEALKNEIFEDKYWEQVLPMISGRSSEPNYIIEYVLKKSQRNDIEKAKTCMSIYNESVLLNKRDFEKHFTLFERCITSFENSNRISLNNIHLENSKITLKNLNNISGFHDLLELISELLKIRFTKYEFDFHGYFEKSPSIFLQSLKKLILKKGNVNIESDNLNTSFIISEESSEIPD